MKIRIIAPTPTLTLAITLAFVALAALSSGCAAAGSGARVAGGARGSVWDVADSLDSSQAGSVLAFVNHPSTTVDVLDHAVALDARAARNLVAGRPFDDVSEVAAVPYLGPKSLRHLAAWIASR